VRRNHVPVGDRKLGLNRETFVAGFSSLSAIKFRDDFTVGGVELMSRDGRLRFGVRGISVPGDFGGGTGGNGSEACPCGSGGGGGGGGGCECGNDGRGIGF